MCWPEFGFGMAVPIFGPGRLPLDGFAMCDRSLAADFFGAVPGKVTSPRSIAGALTGGTSLRHRRDLCAGMD